MSPTLQEGDIVITVAVEDCATLRRGDVITFRPIVGSPITYIKRVAALSAETIEAQDGAIFVDGTEIDFEADTGTWGPITVPVGEVFVLGDNRGASVDSRAFGCIALQQIESKMIGIISIYRDK